MEGQASVRFSLLKRKELRMRKWKMRARRAKELEEQETRAKTQDKRRREVKYEKQILEEIRQQEDNDRRGGDRPKVECQHCGWPGHTKKTKAACQAHAQYSGEKPARWGTTEARCYVERLRQRQDTRERRHDWKCDGCGRAFETEARLSTHERKCVDMATDTWKCAVRECGMIYAGTDARGQKRHTRECEYDETCEHCGQRFTNTTEEEDGRRKKISHNARKRHKSHTRKTHTGRCMVCKCKVTVPWCKRPTLRGALWCAEHRRHGADGEEEETTTDSEAEWNISRRRETQDDSTQGSTPEQEEEEDIPARQPSEREEQRTDEDSDSQEAAEDEGGPEGIRREMIGRRTRKRFGTRYYEGRVTKATGGHATTDGKTETWYQVVYEDGDVEELTWKELE